MSRVVVVRSRVLSSPTRQSAVSEQWERVGRRHFLTCEAFEKHHSVKARIPMVSAPVSPPPTLIAIALCLAVVFAIPFFIYRATQFLCPLAAEVLDRITASSWKVCQRVARAMKTTAWAKPIQRFGLGITLLAWMIGLAIIATLAVLASPSLVSLWGLAKFWLITFLVWRTLHWWAARRYRPHQLPARRRR